MIPAPRRPAFQRAACCYCISISSKKETVYGDLYVSFWEYDGFFIRTKEELETAKAHVRPRPQRGEDSR